MNGHSARWGLVALGALTGFYIAVLAGSGGWEHLVDQTRTDWWLLVPIIVAFGTQVALSAELRAATRPDTSAPAPERAPVPPPLEWSPAAPTTSSNSPRCSAPPVSRDLVRLAHPTHGRRTDHQPHLGDRCRPSTRPAGALPSDVMHRLTPLLAASALAVVLAACGSDDSPVAATGLDTRTSPSESAELTITPTRVDDTAASFEVVSTRTPWTSTSMSLNP